MSIYSVESLERYTMLILALALALGISIGISIIYQIYHIPIACAKNRHARVTCPGLVRGERILPS